MIYTLPTATAPISEHCLFIRMRAKQYDYSIRASFNDYLVENKEVQGNEKLIADIRHELNTTIWVAK